MAVPDDAPLDPVGRLAQYALVPRIAAPGLTLITVQRDPRLAGVLLVTMPLMMVLNYLALRHWGRVIRDLQIARKPLYLALDSLLALTVLEVVGAGTPMVLYLLATGVLAGLVYRAWLALSAGVLSTAGYAVILFTRIGYVPGHLDFHTTVTLPSVLLTAGAAGVALRRLLTEQARSARQLAALREVAAIREERLRMARDLHDSLTKNLHGVWLLAATLEGALDRGDPGPARTAARVIGQTARSLSDEARQAIRGLRDVEPDTQPLAVALQAVAERVTRGHPIELRVRDLRRRFLGEPDLLVRSELLAVTAESLHNTLKHAAAQRVEIRLEDACDGGLDVVVTDDGRGFACEDADALPALGHFGLLGMRERAGRAGGRLGVLSAPGAGTTIRLTLPAGLLTPQPKVVTGHA